MKKKNNNNGQSPELAADLLNLSSFRGLKELSIILLLPHGHHGPKMAPVSQEMATERPQEPYGTTISIQLCIYSRL